MFNSRVTGGIFFASDAARGERIKSQVVDGDSVTLGLKDEHVLVRVTASTHPGHYEGVIYGFEPSYECSFSGLEIGQKINFNEIHIFGCS